MIFLKTPSQINKIEYINKVGAEFLSECYDHIKIGIETNELEYLAIKFCEKHKIKPSFLGYKGFPHYLCVSINDEIVHGFPSDYVIKNGDVVSVDFGLKKDGYFSDAAFTKIVGDVPPRIYNLVKVTEECLYKSILKARPSNRLFDISQTIQSHASDNNFNVIEAFVGHGVGLKVHEDPQVPNYVTLGINWRLKPGMVISIEPMLVTGTNEIKIGKNGWTVFTLDGGIAAHFEHSVAILETGPKILSKI